jgi:hypothetical protein
MPVSKITTNFKLDNTSKFINDFHELIKNTLKVPDHERFIILNQMETGFYPPTNTTGRYILFEISLFIGRTIEIKRALYKQLFQFAQKYDVEVTNIRVTLYEIERENWSLTDGLPASEKN